MIRAGSGLGDSLYLQAIVRHVTAKGERPKVFSNWPALFRGLPVEVVPFARQPGQRVAHYVSRKTILETDQFEDMCIVAGIREPVDLRLDWTVTDRNLTDNLLAAAGGLPIVLVQMPRLPFDRIDRFGEELLPTREGYQAALDAIRDRAFTVLVGRGEPSYTLDGIACDLTGQTSVSQLIDVAHEADGLLGYCSFFVPLAESFNKPALFVWSRKGAQSQEPYIRTILPEKILHRESSRHVWDDASRAEILRAAESLLR